MYVVIGGLRDAERERIARVRCIHAQQNARWAHEEAEREAYLQRRRLEDAQYEPYYSSDGQDLDVDEDTAVAIHNWHVLSNFDTKTMQISWNRRKLSVCKLMNLADYGTDLREGHTGGGCLHPLNPSCHPA